MRGRSMVVKVWFVVAMLTFGVFAAHAQTYEQKLFQEMRWRCIGPFRAGRTVAITGVQGQPNLFYMAAVNGGVWKTTDFGNTWTPIFDDAASSGSVGAIAVAPSNPNILYVGSGEGLQRPDLAIGDGMYKSTDAGKHGHTWDCATRSRSPRSLWIRKTRSACTLRRKAIPMDRTRSEEFFAQAMAGRVGRRSYIKTTTQARQN